MSAKPKYLYWMTNRGAYRSEGMIDNIANPNVIISPNSSCVFNMTFADLPDAPAYALKLEQFSINNRANGNVMDLPPTYPLGPGTQCATGLIEFEGFNPVNGSVFSTSPDPLPNAIGGQMGGRTPPRRRCVLSRFDTSFISTNDLADCAVAPPETPTVLVHKPADGDYTFWIRGIYNPYGQLVIGGGGGNARLPIGDWMACISLEPMTEKEVNKYYNINQPGTMGGPIRQVEMGGGCH